MLFFLCCTVARPCRHSLAARKDNRVNGKMEKKSCTGSWLWPVSLCDLEPAPSLLWECFLAYDIRGPKLFLLWHSIICVSADNHHGSRVWWRCCGGFWFPGVCRVSTKEGICFGKKLMAPNVHFPYLFMKRLVNWSFGEMELTLQKGHYNGIFGWILVSQIHGGRSGACAMCPVPGKNRVCEWNRGLSGLPSFHVFRDRKDGFDKQILWFLIYHMLN